MATSNGPDGLGVFLNRAGKIKLLTGAEEIELGRRIQAMIALQAEKPDPPYTLEERRILRSGKQAKDHMITANIRLVMNLARKFSIIGARKNLTLEDLIQEGLLGLIRGIEKFDPEKGYKLSTYAYWWIRQTIARALVVTGPMIRLPISVKEVETKVARAKAAFAQQGKQAPSLAELAAATGYSESQVEAALYGATTNYIFSLDALTGDDSTQTLGECIPAPSVVDPLVQDAMWGLIEELRTDSRCRDAMALVELQLEAGGRRISEISELLGTTRMQASAVLAEARETLREVAGPAGMALLVG